MFTSLDEKINLIRKINTDDSNFIIKVYETYQNYKLELKNKLELTSITLKNDGCDLNKNIIDLDKIWCKPYFYTKMRIHLEGIIEQISNIDSSEIVTNPSKYCKKVIFHNISKEFEKSENEIDIVDFINKLRQNKLNNPNKKFEFTFVANKIDEETLFKEEQLKKSLEIINISSKQKQYEKIYEEVYSYLKKDFVSNNYCDFKNNKCVAQRHFTLYPFNRKNGCCFTRIRTCPHLQKGGSCNIECMACRLFSCPYLSKRGITYYANEFVLFKAFFNKNQRKHLVFDFYKTKFKILTKIEKT